MLSVVSEEEEGVESNEEVAVEGGNGIRDRRMIVSKEGKGK